MEEGVGEKKDDKNVRIDEGKEVVCPDGTPPDDMEEGVGEKKDDKNVIIDEVKEAACPYGTHPDDMEEGVGEKKDDKNVRLLMTCPVSVIWKRSIFLNNHLVDLSWQV